ncbi:winged helix-turn-helix domain-containing protein [Arvimicrobium flavum]|uniref:winged helix-turn-helix domain-containing protein n=1 Tax=Arvimicrobium flavum TaxID=3393320 RepID=UPI00237C2170|nr:winged helix-turn-helix domain-containing protein [Mesorhizobium shangrilense]
MSLKAARRIALAAQGFGEGRSEAPPTRRKLDRTVSRLGLLQIDSVSAVVRAHYMPLFSRLGPYPMASLDERASKKPRRLFEYWAHEASLLPIDTWPLMQWRMRRAAAGQGIYKQLAAFGRERKAFVDEIYQEVRTRGPIAASGIDGHKGSGGWWGWSDAKHAFEWLFWAGRITTASRRGFERLYDLPERVIPAEILSRPAPSEPDAQRQLLGIAAKALGIGTAACFRDYFRQSPEAAKAHIPELVEAGEILPVRVAGWEQRQVYLHRDARLPRKIEARALLAPFDPLVFERTRAERLFGFRYRIEIYTPAEKRQHGYYVLPFLLGDSPVARVDVKADRPAGVLRVHAAFAESGAPSDTAAELAEEFRLMQGWLGLDATEVTPAGDLGPALARQF